MNDAELIQTFTAKIKAAVGDDAAIRFELAALTGDVETAKSILARLVEIA